MDDKSPSQAATPASGDDTDVSPPSEQVTESGTTDFLEPWIESKCVFCQQELKDLNEPKLLQCLHTACKACLTTESSNSPAPTSSGLGLSVRQLICPMCNQEVNPNDVIDHLFLLEHLSQNSEGFPEESKCYPCSCDEGSDATGFCTDCQEWLCDACVTAHHRVRVTKDHTIRPKDEMEGERPPTGLSQKYLFCPTHSHEPLKLYCESCDKLTCRDCQLSNHKEHKYQFLSNACDEEKGTLNMILSKIKEKQHHIDNACALVNKRHQEITERELAVTQEIKTFAVKFITEINKRGKQLLQELSDVCTNKKTQLSYKNQELLNMGQKLNYCLKFSEAALANGSETALVYSKKVIIGQLKRILKHRCEVPNPQHNVDITFSYEANYLTQYISQLGTLLVDQEPVPRVPLSSTNSTPQQAQNVVPQAQQLQPMQQNVNTPLSSRVNHSQQLVPVNRNPSLPGSSYVAKQFSAQQQQQLQLQQKQQQQMQMQQKQQHLQQKQQQQLQLQKQQQAGQQQHYGQPQVTSSTDPAQNRNAPQGNLRQIMNNSHLSNMRSQVQRTMQSNVSQPQSYSVTNNSNTNNYMQQQQRHVAPQQAPARQPAQQSFTQPVSLPMPLMQNSNITISAIPGPTPPKQRAMAPRQSMQMSAIPNQNSVQRVGNTQQNLTPQRGQQQQQQRPGQPQVIVIDGDGPQQQKTPTMSNTSRLSHFPQAAAAAMSANPGLQIQPVNFPNNMGVSVPPVPKMVLQLQTGVSLTSSDSHQKSNLVTSASLKVSEELDKFAHEVIGLFSNEAQKDTFSQDKFTDEVTCLGSNENQKAPSSQHQAAEANSESSGVITSNDNFHNECLSPLNHIVIANCRSLKKTESDEKSELKDSCVEQTSTKDSALRKGLFSHGTQDEKIKTCDSKALSANSSLKKVANTSQVKKTSSSNSTSSIKSKPCFDEAKDVVSDIIKEVSSTLSVLPKSSRNSVHVDASSVSVAESSNDTVLPTSITNCADSSNDTQKNSEEMVNAIEKSSKAMLNDSNSSSCSSADFPLFNDLFKDKEDNEASDCSKPATPETARTKSSHTTPQIPGGADPNEDYCAVCHDGGELLCCGSCPRVYHFVCHVPVMKDTPYNDWRCHMCLEVENMEFTEYTEAKRRKYGLTSRDLAYCEKLLLQLFCHENSVPFHYKIRKETPGYYNIIKNPMDMSLIKLKLNPQHFEFYKTKEDFFFDVKLMFSNCKVYNPPDSPLYSIAEKLEAMFEEQAKVYFPDYDSYKWPPTAELNGRCSDSLAK